MTESPNRHEPAGSERRRHARQLFSTLGPAYDRMGAVLSFGQDPRWRRFMVSRLPEGPQGRTVLDVATGTGLVAERLLAAGLRGDGPRSEPGDAGGGAAALRRARDAGGGVRRRAAVRRMRRSTTSRSRTCCATSTILRRRCGSWPGWCGPGARSRRSSSACRAGCGGRRGSCTCASGCLRPGASCRRGGTRWAGSSAPRSATSGLAGRWSASSQAWREAGVVDVRHRRMSLGGGIVVWGTRDDVVVPAAPG